ncbi:MAG TPA: SBBP repeat-containing protein, partial [Xanthomonadales bacterium]|nr:SBBP repeat-containing protein [Xanthomonadales bacterium]
ALVYSTYLGGAEADQGFGIGVDLVGSAYVAGFTESLNFPTQNAFQTSLGGGRDAFVSKLAETSDGDFIFANGFE